MIHPIASLRLNNSTVKCRDFKHHRGRELQSTSRIKAAKLNNRGHKKDLSMRDPIWRQMPERGLPRQLHPLKCRGYNKTLKMGRWMSKRSPRSKVSYPPVQTLLLAQSLGGRKKLLILTKARKVLRSSKLVGPSILHYGLFKTKM